MKHRLFTLGSLIFFLIITSSAGAAVGPAASGSPTRGIGVVAVDRTSGQQKEVKLYGKAYAVIIGIDQYKNLSFDRQLSYAVRDAKGVEAVLRENYKFDDIITIYNRDATKDNILKILSGDLSKLNEDDSLFVFWAGHGYTEKTNYGDLGYLVPFDGTFEKSELYRNISMTVLKDDVSKRIPAKHVFFVMDACYSGLLAVTRGGEQRRGGRDFAYLQQITTEKARQVLAAGTKEQQVLDGGPKGHSVFTGRLIEYLENADDFITATELATAVKEKVFSDARSRNHIQTPQYGELFGVGDYVFVPSMEKKVEDAQANIAAMEKEMTRLKELEAAAAKASDDRTRRQAALEQRAIEAKLKAEQLRQQALEDEKKKRAQAEEERRREQAALAQKKQAEDSRLAALKTAVAEKREQMGGATLAALSPDTTLTEMRQVDARIQEVKTLFREELKKGIKAIVDRYNEKFLRLAAQKKDEFETAEEFKKRIAGASAKLNTEQAGEFTAYQDKLEAEYKRQAAPLIEQLRSLSKNEFTLTAENLILELGTYNGEDDSYPLTIRSRQPVQGVMIAANSNVPIPRQEAREFKLHFDNDILRPEIRGNFFSGDTFMIAEAYVMDDANTKKYDLFAARLVDLGNGTLYDTKTKLIWSREGSGKEMVWDSGQAYIWRLNEQSHLGFRDWRMPTKEELQTLVSYARSKGYNGSDGKTVAALLNREGFNELRAKWYWTATTSGSSDAWGVDFKDGLGDAADRDDNTFYVLAVRSGR